MSGDETFVSDDDAPKNPRAESALVVWNESTRESCHDAVQRVRTNYNAGLVPMVHFRIGEHGFLLMAKAL